MYQFSDKTDIFDFLGPNLPKNGFWGQNFKNKSLDLESASLRYYVYQFSDKTENFGFLNSNLLKNEIWGRNLHSESTSPIYRVCVPIFSQKGKLLIFQSKFGEIAQLRAIFRSKYCSGCCRGLIGGGWNWMEVKMSWVEADVTGWCWVEVGARFSNTLFGTRNVMKFVWPISESSH